MKSRKLGIALLIMLAFVVTTGTFAYWASSVVGTDSTNTATVTIGSGDAVTTSLTITDQTSAGPLVPVGHSGTNSVTLTFPVTWTSDNDAAADNVFGLLDVTVDSIEMSDGYDVSGLFTVTIDGGASISGQAIEEDVAQTVTVVVTFTNEPADQAEYNEVASQDLVVTLSFDVTPNN